jgi:hypothetical protein
MKSKPTKGRVTKQLPTGRPAGKKELLPKISGSKTKKQLMPKFNEKKIEDMLTGRKPVPGMKKKPKTGEQLKEAIRKKTGVYPNTAN